MAEKFKIPLAVWILTLSAFAIGTAEFVIAGLLPDVADSLHITEGQVGNLITFYALAIVIGGPVMTLWLARFDKRNVLIWLMVLFIVGNVIAAYTSDYRLLLASRVIAGLTQGPFFGIGAIVATRMVAKNMAGKAVGQMFAGLTLANVLGVPLGAWIGNAFGWNSTFLAVGALGAITMIILIFTIPHQGRDAPVSVRKQLGAFRDANLLTSLAMTLLSGLGL